MTLVNRHRATLLDARDIYLEFEGKELRPLITVDIRMADSGLRVQIMNIHLQSLKEEGMARQAQIQLAALLAYQAFPKMTFVVGDTNFYTEAGMNVASVFSFVDVWRQLRPTDTGHTFGVTYPTKEERQRIDAIFHWPDRRLSAKSISMFGQQPLGCAEGVFLSDHVGLFASFEYVLDQASDMPKSKT